MMGPYMKPMAVNLPLTMIMSLVVAFTVTPWMSYHVLKGEYGKHEEKEFVLEETKTYRIYRKILEPFLTRRPLAWGLILVVVLLLLISMAMPALNLVPLKMLPFDNKNEFQLVIDLPEGATLEQTDAVARDLEDYLTNGQRGDRFRGLCRYRQRRRFQRHGPSLLHAPGAEPR